MKRPEKDVQFNKLLITNYLLAVVGAVLILAFFTVYLINDFRNYQRSQQERIQAITRVASSRAQTVFDNILVTMRLLDEWIQQNPERDPRYDSEFNALVNIFRKHNGDRIDLRMVTVDGGLFYLPATEKTPLANISDREYFQIQQNKLFQSLYFANPVLSRVTGKWGIPITYKLRQNDHDLLILFAAVEFPVLDSLFPDLLRGANAAVSVVRSDQTILYRTPFDENLIGTRVTSIPGNKNYRILQVDGSNYAKRLLFSERLADVPILVIYGEDYDTLLQAWIKSALIKSGIAALILLGYVLLSIRGIYLLYKVNEVKKQLEVIARFDSLTGLKTRGYFFDRVTEEMERARRYNTDLVMLIADIDHFKIVNDVYGHPAGDEILRKIAAIFENDIRGIDIAGRVGGEEFAILLTDTNIEKAYEIANRIRLDASAITLDQWAGGISIGAAQWKGRLENVDQLYKRSDDALYEAKRLGRNRVEISAYK